MKKSELVLIGSIIFLLGFLELLYAGPPMVEVGPNFKSLQLGRYVEVLRDQSNQLKLNDIISPVFAHEFKPHNEYTFSYGLDSSSYWYRFRMQKKSDFEQKTRLMLVVTRPGIEEVDLYIPTDGSKDNKYRHIISGIKHAGNSDDLGHRVPTVILPDDIPNNSLIYICVRSTLSLYSITLYSESAYNRIIKFEYMFFGLAVGIVLSMFFYNLVLAAFLQDRIYLIYCTYIGFIGCYVALQSGWPFGLGLNPRLRAEIILEVCAVALFFGIVFSRSFLNTKNHAILDRIMLLLIALSTAIFFISLIGFYDLANTIAFFVGLIGPIVMISAAIIRWRQGYKPARYYMAAWIVLFFSIFCFSASGLGFLGYSFVVDNSLSIGTSLESILLSFALADRIQVLRKESAKLKEQERRLTELSITDELTGLFNKRWFSSKILSEIEHARRLSRPLSLMILDVDHFKKLNDTYGHAAGDNVLAELGRIISASVRQSDIPCRYGGEEFSIIMPDADSNDSMIIAERLRKKFGSQQFKTEQDGNVRATISLGITQLADDDTKDTLFERADKALFHAKTQGRNQSVRI
ncbi:MAG: sensor domain-containing diguanylate cyclase [Desulfobacterales bacterium]|jgi:diguanylate cyclase (GGDEF)-like protein|nr:sensor domain-containing diguanylate cyclase [Acidobacteriota bacterium]MCU0599783.1 sensor domain-containing diguanylate cyclase [Desulfobacterales bacterium]